MQHRRDSERCGDASSTDPASAHPGALSSPAECLTEAAVGTDASSESLTTAGSISLCQPLVSTLEHKRADTLASSQDKDNISACKPQENAHCPQLRAYQHRHTHTLSPQPPLGCPSPCRAHVQDALVCSPASQADSEGSAADSSCSTDTVESVDSLPPCVPSVQIFTECCPKGLCNMAGSGDLESFLHPDLAAFSASDIHTQQEMLNVLNMEPLPDVQLPEEMRIFHGILDCCPQESTDYGKAPIMTHGLLPLEWSTVSVDVDVLVPDFELEQCCWDNYEVGLTQDGQTYLTPAWIPTIN